METFDYLRLRTDPAYRAKLTQWVQSDDVLREEGRLLAKTNLLALLYVLGYTKIDPVIHREALQYFLPRDLSKPVWRQGEGQLTKGTLLYPRATYKTTIDEGDCVQEVICFPLDCILFILAANQKLADAMVDNVAAHFTRPKHAAATLFQSLFPELCIPPNARETGKFSAGLRQVEPPIKEHAVMGFSVESGVSGWHCWRLKCDDIANNRNMKNETSQAEVYRNYRINRKMLNPGGIEDKLGTRYGPFDPYGLELQKSRPGSYRYVIKPALRLRNGQRLDANGFPPREEMELLFEPLGLTYELLRDDYDNDYSSFMTQYMNDAMGDNEVTFAEAELLGAVKPAETLPIDGELFIHWRMPNRGSGWKHAAAAVGMLRNNRMHIIDAIHGSYKPSLLAAKVVQLAKKHDAAQVYIEASPGAQQLDPTIRNYALTMGYPLSIHWTEFQAEQGVRETRLKGLEPLLAANRLVFSSELSQWKAIYEQFSHFGIVGEDGLVDVIAQACEWLPKSIAMSYADQVEATLARELAMERDHYNMIYGQAQYAEREPETDLAALALGQPEIERDPRGLSSILPGLNG